MPTTVSSSFSDRRASALFQKLKKITRRVSSEPSPERVHQLRTTTRRIETLLDAVGEKPASGKLLKQLSRLRRRAGKVRDIDIQMAALGEIKLETADTEKTRVMRHLQKVRDKREKKLMAAAEAELDNDLSARMKDVAHDLASRSGKMLPRKDYAAVALEEFATLVHEHPALNENTLHAFRKSCKRVRYLAEMGDDQPAEQVASQLKRIQDAVGDWHDGLMLTETARGVVSSHSPLGTMLQTRVRARFVEALRTTAAVKAHLLQMRGTNFRKQPQSIREEKVLDLKRRAYAG